MCFFVSGFGQGETPAVAGIGTPAMHDSKTGLCSLQEAFHPPCKISCWDWFSTVPGHCIALVVSCIVVLSYLIVLY